jgi:hypothetical protein
VQSRLGRGSVFTVVLPVVAAAESRQQDESVIAETTEVADG